MLPPIPQSLPPVTAQQDVNKPKPVVAAVTPAAETSSESALNLDKRHPQDVQDLLREEQRRRQRQVMDAAPDGEEEAEPAEPVAEHPLIEDDLPRQGVWVDIEV
ncbi:aspartate-semialdehyde dehydrogenase [Pseudomonas marincola]|uniref:aspartate-semialdehyde dehydrogenase n=1 Tax=Pseudomonas marincola TaxID=437900 RepID=UPI0008E856F3|nr:aspartate-semialdehyde dehydrogenase [Pseudomonas marincola]SFU05221.1 hypothetical protein SAMN05216264_109158 [Pseudomonas marincola]